MNYPLLPRHLCQKERRHLVVRLVFLHSLLTSMLYSLFPSFLSFFLLSFLFLLLPLSLPPTVFYLFLLMHCVRIKDSFAFTPVVKVITMHASPTDYYPSPMSFKRIYTSSFTRSSTIHVRSNHKNTF